MNRKSLYRLVFMGLLGLFAWTCNLSDSKSDTLTLHVADSLLKKYGKYDSIRIDVFVVNRQDSSDTLYSKVIFHGPYLDSAQLVNMSLGKIPSRDFIVVLVAYRAGAKALVLGLPFDQNGPGNLVVITPDTLRPPRVNHRPRLSLASPDSGKTDFHLREGRTLSFRVAVKDTDGGDSAFLLKPSSLPSACGQVDYDTATGNFSFKPGFSCIDSSGDSSVADLEFMARDKGLPPLLDTLKLRLVVEDSNSAPKWNKDSVTGLQGKEGKSISLDLDSLFAGDAEKDSVSFSASLGAIGESPLRWTFTPSFSDSGKKQCVISASDHHKTPASSQITLKFYVVDSTRVLDVVINSPANGFVTRDTVIPVRWSINGAVQSAQATAALTQEGPNGIKRESRDSLGNYGYDTITVIRDRTPPSKPQITGPGLTNNPKPKWTWRTGGGGDGRFRFRLDSANLSGDTVGLVDTAFTPSTNLNEGKHVLYVQERDAAGNWSPVATDTARLQLTGPLVAITSPANGFITRDTVIAVKWTVNGAPQSAQTTERLTQEGPNGVKRSFMDSSGNTGSDSITVILDRASPVKPVLTGPGRLLNNPKPTWTWKGGGGGNGYFRFKVDTSNLASDTVGIKDTAFTASANLVDGSHVFYVQERDSAGNWSPTALDTVQIDATKPRIVIASPADNFLTRQTSIDVYWTKDSVAQSKVTRSLVEGANILTVVGTDAAGNTDSASITVRRDTVPPGKPRLTGSGLGNNPKPKWSWQTGGNGGNGYFRFKVDTSNLASDTVGLQDTAFVPPANLSEGNHVLYVEERDSAGNWSVAALDTVRLDLTKPRIVITSPSDNFLTRQSSIDVYWTKDGVAQSAVAMSLSEGANTLTVTGADSAGNTDSASITVRRDGTPPGEPTVRGPGLTHNPRPVWTWNGGAGSNGVYRFKLDTSNLSGDTVGVGDTSFTPGADLSEGSHVFYVQTRDSAGNWSTTALDTARLDLTKPRIVITSPPDNFLTRQASVDVYWTQDNVALPAASMSLSEGANTLTVTGTDSAGNTDSASITVIRDTQGPNKTVVAGPGLTNSPRPQWTWHGGGNGGIGYFRFKLDTSSLSDTVGIGDTSFTPAADLSEGNHVLYIQERDLAGNWSTVTQDTGRVDLTGPDVAITSPSDNFLTRQTSIDVYWTQDGVAQSPVNKSLVEGANTLTVTGTDSAGNANPASITVIRDTQGPNKTVVTGPGLTRNQKPTWTWISGGNGGNGYFRFQIDDSIFTDTVGVTDLSHTPPADLAAGDHVLYVQERDLAGNWSTLTQDTARVDLTGPSVVITSPPDNFLTRQTSIDVYWTQDGAAQSPVNKSLVEGSNTLTVTGTDSAGNPNSASITVFRDTEAPNQPVVVGPGLTRNQKPDWTWSSGGNGGAGYFRFQLDDDNFTDTVGVTNLSFTPGADLSEGNHVLYIQERDGAGNWSAMDSSGIARIDITSPVVVFTYPPDGTVTNQANLDVTWDVDGSGLVDARYPLNEGVNTITKSATDSAGNTGSASITVTRRSTVIFVDVGTADPANADGNSWAKAYPDLQTALSKASSGNEIWVARGTYKPALGIPSVDTNTFDTSFVMKTGVNMYGGFKGTENAQNLRDYNSNETRLSGERGNVADITDNLGPILLADADASLDGFVVERGYRRPTLEYVLGAGLLNSGGGSPKILNCVFRENVHASPSGSGAMTLSSATALVQNCTFSKNTGLAGAVTIGGSTEIRNCLFQDNNLAITVSYRATPLIETCVFKDNTEGGISDGGSSTILNSVFIGNKNPNGGGGAITGFEMKTTIKNCVFNGNFAASGHGGAIQGFSLDIFNSVFVGNSTSLLGGAVYVRDDWGSATATTVKNSIFFGNTSKTGDDQIMVDGISADAVLFISFTDIQDGASGIGVSGLGVVSPSDIITGNPQFNNTADPAGSDGKYFTSDDGFNLSSSSGSPCINTGDTDISGTTSKDITGASRVQSGRIDMGAYEQ